MSNMIEKLEQSISPDQMTESIQEFLAADEVYATDLKDLAVLEQRCDELPLAYLARLVINDYIACLESSISRTNELSYLAGFRDALQQKDAEE